MTRYDVTAFYDPITDRLRGIREERAEFLLAVAKLKLDVISARDSLLASRAADLHLRQHGGRHDDRHPLAILANRHYPLKEDA